MHLSVALSLLLTADGFDPPRRHTEVAIAHSESGQPGKVSCDDYDGFRIKQVDLGEKGAEELSMLTFNPRSPPPPCRRADAPGERGVTDWFGYFKGVKGRYAFFDGDDGWEAGSVGFAVFSVDTGKKLFDDAAVGSLHFSPTGLSFRRAFRAKCSVLADAKCWKQTAAALGLTGAIPDCATAYRGASEGMAKARCRVRDGRVNDVCIAEQLRDNPMYTADDPSVFVYDVTIDALAHPVIRPSAPAEPVGCAPGM